jgi:hypothetical protein
MTWAVSGLLYLGGFTQGGALEDSYLSWAGICRPDGPDGALFARPFVAGNADGGGPGSLPYPAWEAWA